MKEDKTLQFLRKMQDNTNYIEIGNLKNQYSYKIVTRNAYVGIWLENKKAFLISRYKVGPYPYLFFEYHWDIGEPYGTVKPLKLIEKCPFTIKEDYDDNEKEEMLKYLDRLEENNPIIDGVNSLQARKMSAINFQVRLTGKHKKI